MRTILFFAGLFGILFNTSLFGQINTPPPSPSATIEQGIGLSTVTINYSRPGVKGRTIFGDLVPFDKIWRTGANASTKVEFSDDVKLGGVEVPKGTYAIYTKPGKEEWTVMIYKDLGLGGAVGRYDEANELGRFTAKVEKLPMSVETMTFMIGDISNDKANIYLMWENTMVAMPIEVEVDSRVMAQIESAMGGPSAGEYYNAALYYYNTDRDLDQALSWINKSLEGNERFWMVTWKARILGKMGKKKEAIAASNRAMELAKEANNSDYIKINEDLIAGWKDM